MFSALLLENILLAVTVVIIPVVSADFARRLRAAKAGARGADAGAARTVEEHPATVLTHHVRLLIAVHATCTGTPEQTRK